MAVLAVIPIALLAGSLIGSVVGALLPQSTSGNGLNDMRVTSSTYGQPIPKVWGTTRLGGNLIWAQNIQKTGSGGKGFIFGGGGGGGSTSGGGSSAPTFSWSGAVGICVGPITAILKIWADTKLVFDATGQSGSTLNKYNLVFRVYPGSEDQLPDPILEAMVGSGQAEAYRGMAYVVFDNIPLINYANRVPNWTFEVVSGVSTSVQQGIEGFVPGDYAVTGTTGTSALGDWNKNRLFIFSEGNGKTNGIRAFKLDTGSEYLEANIQHIYGVLNGGNYVTTNGGGAACLGFDGYIHLVQTPTPTCQMAKIDPDSLTNVASFGIASGNASGSSGRGILSPGTISPIQVPSATGTTNFIIAGAAAPNREVSVYCSDTMQFSGLAFNVTENRVLVTRGGHDAAEGWAFAIGLDNYGPGPSSNPVGLYRINVQAGADAYDATLFPTLTNSLITHEKMGTFSPSDVDPDWTEFSNVQGAAFDQSDGNLILMVGTPTSSSPTSNTYAYTIKIAADSGAIIWAVPLNTNDPLETAAHSDSIDQYGAAGLRNANIVNGTYGFLSYATDLGGGDTGTFPVYIFDTLGGTMVRQEWDGFYPKGAQVWDEQSGGILYFGDWSNPTALTVAVDNLENGVLKFLGEFFTGLVGQTVEITSEWTRIFVTGNSGDFVPLSQVVTEICEMVNLQSTDLDVTDLTDDMVQGYAMAQQMTAKDALTPLAAVFSFDAVESDGLIKFIKRGNTPTVTIPSTNLARLESKLNSLVEETRIQEVDLPNQVNINFYDPSHDFQTASTYAKRPFNPTPTMYSNNTSTTDIPIVSTPALIRQAADRILYSTWANRTNYKVKLPWDYLIYDPTDILTLQPDGNTSATTRLINMDLGTDWSIDTNMVLENPALYTSTLTGYGGEGFTIQTISIPGASQFIPIDCPLLRDTDDTGQHYTLMYYAGGGYSDSWPGLELFKSSDQSSYVDVGGIVDSATWGTTSSTLGDPVGVFGLDTVNTLNIAMHEGAAALSSVTFLQMCNGANAGALLKSDGTVEVIQFQTVVVNPDGSVTLSNLLRGRRGTETMAYGHATGESFVLLTPGTGTGKSNIALSDVGQIRYYKPVTFGTLLENASIESFVSEGRPLMPYAPVHITATLSGSDINLAWVRRTRLGGAWLDGTGIVPLAEATEAYAADIYDNFGNVLRSLLVDFGPTPVSNPGITYHAADIVTDFGSTPTSLAVAVAQVSAAVGRGFARAVTVPVV